MARCYRGEDRQRDKKINRESESQTREGEETFSLIQLADFKLYFIKIPLMLMMINTAIFTAN